MFKPDKQDVATILAALRCYQRDLQAGHPSVNTADIVEIATDGGEVEAMTPKQIDFLCEQINCGAGEHDLVDLLAIALPYVEDAVLSPAFKRGAVKRVAAEIRAAIEAHS